MKNKLFLTLLGLLFVRTAWATVPIYDNQDFLEYTIPGNPPPQIDAKSFVNENTFIIDFSAFNPGTPFYETMNTMYYTNTGLIVANSPDAGIPNQQYTGLGFQNFGCGYLFDLQNNDHLWADTFYNPGTIRGVSTIDGNSVLFNGFLFGIPFFQLIQYNAYGDVEVKATNIINPGTIDVSVSGKINLAGSKVDLTGANLTIEPPLSLFGTLGNVNFSGSGALGTSFNIWDPINELTANTATSSVVSISPFTLIITNSQCYYQQDAFGTFVINRYVFIQNVNTNIPYNVYFAPFILTQPPLDPLSILGFGAAHVEWVAGYNDLASAAPITSYLYLNDDYELGTTTNIAVVGGLPGNFTFDVASTPQIGFVPPTASGFVPVISGFQIPNYSCFFGGLNGSTEPTNVSTANPHGTITNLTGQIYISASNELNMAFTTINEPNYMNLRATNQFDGSPGASIMVPYSDIALGVTNGFLTMSNVLTAQLPNWSGQVDAWSTVWLDTTTFPGITNEYEVEIVYANLQPTTQPWIQNLYLHDTNTLVISDPLNVYGSLYSDARTVVLNTNELGAGATSMFGQLWWLNPNPLNGNSGSGLQQFPNLLWLTNSGNIQAVHNATFGNSSAPQFVPTPAVPAIRATGMLAVTGTNAVLGDKVTIGTNVYTFVKVLANGSANQVLWAANSGVSLSNLIAAINGAAGAGTKYSTATKVSKFVTASSVTNHAFTVWAVSTNSAVGNAVVTAFAPATLSVNLSWGGATLMNGMDYIGPVPIYSAFVNHSLIGDQGTAIFTTYFENDGTISNGSGSFTLQSSLAILTNGSTIAGGDVVLQATNSPGTGVDSLIISNHMIQAGRKLTLSSTNITDTGVTNGNIWTVGANSGGGSFDSGFNAPIPPPPSPTSPWSETLLGTTVTNISPPSKTVYNVWAGKDFGINNQGYNNNLAVGHLVIDIQATNTQLAYVCSGTGVSNAMYVDLLELRDGATIEANATIPTTTNAFNFRWLKVNTNMIIYFAQAMDNGNSVAAQIDHWSQLGLNGGRLRWVYSYAGYFSSTNIVYTNSDGSVTTNAFNTALAQSSDFDSDSDGFVNAKDPTPFFMPQEINLTANTSNAPPHAVRVQWTTIPNATNFVYYTTNLMATNSWKPFTNFNNWYFGNNVPTPNPARNYFHSPQVYIASPPMSAPDNFQQTNVWFFDTATNIPHYYKVVVWPWLLNP